MPKELPENDIAAAKAALAFARQTRAFHRRRTAKTSEQRINDIAEARARLRAAMKPLRTHIGQFPYGPKTPSAEANRQVIRDVALAMGAERRKLTKMSK